MVVFLAEALCDRLRDYEENVRKGVVTALCDVACHSPDAIPIETIKVVAERVRDKSVSFTLLFFTHFNFFHLFSSV
jgi:sister-chromatid-cohesion protein PDS5